MVEELRQSVRNISAKKRYSQKYFSQKEVDSEIFRPQRVTVRHISANKRYSQKYFGQQEVQYSYRSATTRLITACTARRVEQKIQNRFIFSPPVTKREFRASLVRKSDAVRQ